ncbi:hypothetical protein LYNGBM3L_08450 [Moorena producens 3L]|uniref:Uncharacterized protein n=1 Tax=Moorena producens 3L TaxID=489825 RepID=F4XJ86_9CYAN|nr:hypothetical protein LYNGBM3L_08450 [Moorena producens 3L]
MHFLSEKIWLVINFLLRSRLKIIMNLPGIISRDILQVILPAIKP